MAMLKTHHLPMPHCPSIHARADSPLILELSRPVYCTTAPLDGYVTLLAIIHRAHDLGLTCGTYHCGENVENAVGETDNRILKETKCHSETIEVPLMEKCI